MKKICKAHLDDVYPNIYVTVRIMMTTSISVIFMEHNFPKLKLIKNYLRQDMSRERSEGLAMLPIRTRISEVN